MAIITSQVSVDPTTPTLLLDVNPIRRRFYVKCLSGNDMYVSGSDTLDDTNGYHIDVNEEFMVEATTPSDCSARNAIYAYHTHGTAQTIAVMEITD